jgi:hypothetical protein
MGERTADECGVINDLWLVLFHPPRRRDEYELKGTQDSSHHVSALSPARKSVQNLREFKQIKFSDRTRCNEMTKSLLARQTVWQL